MWPLHQIPSAPLTQPIHRYTGGAHEPCPCQQCVWPCHPMLAGRHRRKFGAERYLQASIHQLDSMKIATALDRRIPQLDSLAKNTAASRKKSLSFLTRAISCSQSTRWPLKVSFWSSPVGVANGLEPRCPCAHAGKSESTSTEFDFRQSVERNAPAKGMRSRVPLAHVRASLPARPTAGVRRLG